jgi:hypothetical protein
MIKIPDSKSHFSVADWIELYLATTAENISKADIINFLEKTSLEEPTNAFIDSVWNELTKRQYKYQNPPFAVDGNIIDRKIIYETNSYTVCLIFSLFGLQGGSSESSKLFERISAHVIKEYLKGEVYLMGWPTLKDKPISIKEKVRELCNKLNEDFNTAPKAKYKDRGVDIVAWKQFDDKRSSQCVILVQCAAGKDWKDKTTKDNHYESWTQYIHWACNPLQAFFVPCIIPDYDWHDYSRDAGILFDRIRITNLLKTGLKDKELNIEINNWVRKKVKEYSIN